MLAFASLPVTASDSSGLAATSSVRPSPTRNLIVQIDGSTLGTRPECRALTRALSSPGAMATDISRAMWHYVDQQATAELAKLTTFSLLLVRESDHDGAVAKDVREH